MTAPTPNVRLIEAQRQHGLSNRQLALTLRRQATLEGKRLAEPESLVTMISRWRNGHQQPDDFHRPLLCKVLGKTAHQLGLDLPVQQGQVQDSSESSFTAETNHLVVEHDDAVLDYNEGRYHLRMSRRLVNRTGNVVTRYLVRIAVDRYPDDPKRSNEHHRQHPLTLDDLNLQAWSEDEPMRWEVKTDRDTVKELWLLFENDDAKFPLYPGETRWIHYSYSVDEQRWGRWFQRAVRLPTRRLSVQLSFPTLMRPVTWGTETSTTEDNSPLRTPVRRETDDERTVYTWETEEPVLGARYRLEWKFRASGASPQGRDSVPSAEELTTQLSQLGIRQQGDPVLTQCARAFDLPTEADKADELREMLLRYLVRLQELHPFTKGRGLAAPQIGVLRSLAVVRPARTEPIVLVNPVVIEEGEAADEQYEGCLSFFGVRGCVPRPLTVTVQTTDLDGTTRLRQFEQDTARLVLHEIDHLEGRLYTDRLGDDARLLSLDDYRARDRGWRYQEQQER